MVTNGQKDMEQKGSALLFEDGADHAGTGVDRDGGADLVEIGGRIAESGGHCVGEFFTDIPVIAVDNAIGRLRFDLLGGFLHDGQRKSRYKL